ncbi:MAG TPA: FKBP-type peptidyl-prolyl cis-trans isomerase [Flavisolibacter sp.]|jgi:FKBP-type peptidyl-prolyl cis-trans isomerase FkpA|nr:FKBP-type peptidyl-prolyl cis-trans isomerase [Flavisolibacter sp.]
MIRKLALVFFVFAFFSGCLKSKQQTCDYNACSAKAPASEIQAVQDYLTSQGITNAQQHCSGMYYVIENAGTGKQPSPCDAVDVNYVGKLTNGSQFDAGTNYRNYLTSLIRGWANAIPLIKEGGTIHLYIPPSLGYGSQANGPIPANSVLVFDVTLNAVL